MKAANTYLTFDGNCRQAMTFYGKCFEAEPNLTTFSAGPPEVAAAAKASPDGILHAELANGPVVLMASDTMPGRLSNRATTSRSVSAVSLSRKWRNSLPRLAKTVR